MSITIRLLESNKEISDKINKALLKDIGTQIRKNRKTAIDRLSILVAGWIREQPEIDSLLADSVQGSLNAQFGLVGGTSSIAVNDIINAVVSSVEVVVRRDIQFSNSFAVEFFVQPEKFQNLLGLQSGKVTTLKGTVLEWLEWLLLLGNQQVIFGYSYKPDNSGRSGGGVMQGGGVFRVLPQFAGVIDNNFITRALSNRDKDLQSIFEGLFK